jgi:hypothetical protein
VSSRWDVARVGRRPHQPRCSTCRAGFHCSSPLQNVYTTRLSPLRIVTPRVSGPWQRTQSSHYRICRDVSLPVPPLAMAGYTRRLFPGAEKKWRTTKTWKVDIATIRIASPILKRVILHFVDSTVDLFLWSRVRKSTVARECQLAL